MSDTAVFASPYDGDKELELLPFWRLYVEHHYRPRWVPLGTYTITEDGGRYAIAKRSTKLLIIFSDDIVAKELKTKPDYVANALTGLKKGRELLRHFVEAIKGPLGKVVEEDGGYTVYHVELPTEAFLNDVISGKIRDPATGLPVSVRQVQGREPEGGFLQEVAGGSKDYYLAKSANKLGYYRGLVVKICGDYMRELQKHHNTWAVITKVIDAYHYEVVKEWTGERLIIRDTDVKAIIGDAFHDYIGLGEERHRREVIPIIRKALEGKIPIPERWEFNWPRPPIRQAYVELILDFKGNIERAIMRAQRKVEIIEKRRHLYDPEDFRRAHGEAVLWLKLYKLLQKRLERLEKGDGVKRLFVSSREDFKDARKLALNGIPSKRKDGIYVLEEDFEDAMKALLR